MVELLIRVLERLEWSRGAVDGHRTRRIRVHTATGDVTVLVRIAA